MADAPGRGDDRALMSGIAAGDAAALRDLYDRHAGQVLALCRRILRDRAEAEEALGDVFWELWEKADRYREDRGAVLPYLMMVARSRAIDRLRRRRREDAVVDPATATEGASLAPPSAAAEGPYHEAAASEQKARIRRALSGLAAAERRAVELSFFDGLSHGEIARALQEPLGTVKSRIRQGLLRLRDALADEYGRPERAPSTERP
jgi:RNA polymerase sigma-70 factor (ECF subfamily)